VGDVLRVKTSANGIKELDVVILETTANTITLDGVVSADFAVGDTVDILRPVPQLLSSDGTTLASIASAPLQINVRSGGSTATETVIDDQDTPANTVPIPVKLFGVAGSLNITANDLNVQLSHTGANPDSVRLGDGTTLVNVTLANELKTNDASAITELQAIKALDFSTETTLSALSAKFGSLGQKTMAGSAPVTIASDQAAIPISSISGAISLPTGAATEAKQDTGNTSLATIAGKDFSTETTLSALNSKFSSLGQKASATSAPMVLSTEQEAILSAIKTAVELIDNAIAGTEMQVDLVSIGGAATEVTASAINAKLPASLGQQNKAGSLSVVLANDYTTLLNVVSFIQHKFATSNVSDSAYTQLISDIGASAGKKVRIFYAGGEPMYLATGAAASETNRMIIWPGMDAEIDLAVLANARLSLKAVNSSTTINSGTLVINVLG
jgi:spore maturation protein SpmB